VRGGFIITAYGGVLAAHLAASFAGRADLTPILGWIGGPLAAMTSVYTAYLFGQARARDLWQSPLLPAHLLVQAFVAGGAVLLLVPGGAEAASSVTASFQLALAAHLVLVLGEASMGHPTAHAALAARAMTRGEYAHYFWVAVPLGVLGLVFAASTPSIAAGAALGSLVLYEHAFVQAGQSVPLA
jgi:Ni/Fe-hydrogenase subunit HybB-like protein